MAVKILPEANELLVSVRERADRAILKTAIADASRVDGDRVLDRFEADAIRAAFQTAVPAGEALSAENEAPFRSALAANIEALVATRPEHSRVLFTSAPGALESVRGTLLGAMQNTVDRAAGRPVDINIMIFSFTDPRGR